MILFGVFEYEPKIISDAGWWEYYMKIVLLNSSVKDAALYDLNSNFCIVGILVLEFIIGGPTKSSIKRDIEINSWECKYQIQ